MGRGPGRPRAPDRKGQLLREEVACTRPFGTQGSPPLLRVVTGARTAPMMAGPHSDGCDGGIWEKGHLLLLGAGLHSVTKYLGDLEQITSRPL